ncbi:MAG: HAMP domain-containing sensor histidine kinase [Parcubacteria group bacterium]
MHIENDLNLKRQADKLGVSIWRTPSFLFIIIGIINAVAMAVTYYISKQYDRPEFLVVAESVVVACIFSIGKYIIGQFEEIDTLSKMKTEFVSVASHQLRTPLSAIRWETELMLSKLDRGLNKKQRQSINTINLLATRMTRLVNDLLDVTRIDQGRLILKREKVDIAGIVTEISGEFLPLIKEKKMKVVFQSARKCKTDRCKPLSVLSDQEKLKLVIENLFSNAIKYTGAYGRIEIDLSKKRGFVVFSIRDNGVGIPKEQQVQVFSKFFRSDNIVKYQTEGTGLGLYIAKNIIEQSGGRMWFHSREHTGSIFCFSLPAA